MIDLHCHLLPGIDDGPASLAEALSLARLSAEQGITTIACTPHIMAGVYDTPGPTIRALTALMQTALDGAGVAIRLVVGADVHIAPDNVAMLRSGAALAIADSRYVLIELPHHLLPPRVDRAFFDIMAAGFVPVLTHPERMGWIEREYETIRRLARAGVPMQITAGALTGAFGRRVRYWAELMLDEGAIDLVASDAHGAINRPPLLAEAREVVLRRVGAERARRIFTEVPEAILADRPLSAAPALDIAERPGIRGNGLFARTREWLDRARPGRQADHA